MYVGFNVCLWCSQMCARLSSGAAQTGHVCRRRPGVIRSLTAQTPQMRRTAVRSVCITHSLCMCVSVLIPARVCVCVCAGHVDCVDYHRLGVRVDDSVFLRCNSTSLCVLPHWVCDGVDDCGDYSDETHCHGTLLYYFLSLWYRNPSTPSLSVCYKFLKICNNVVFSNNNRMC